MKKISINSKRLHKAVAQSSKIEGLSFNDAQKNKKLIQTLKSYGRAFSVLRQR